MNMFFKHSAEINFNINYKIDKKKKTEKGRKKESNKMHCLVNCAILYKNGKNKSNQFMGCFHFN